MDSETITVQEIKGFCFYKTVKVWDALLYNPESRIKRTH